jgi:hypothetical protein
MMENADFRIQSTKYYSASKEAILLIRQLHRIYVKNEDAAEDSYIKKLIKIPVWIENFKENAFPKC